MITHWGSARREELLAGRGRCPRGFFGKETFSCADFGNTSHLPRPLVFGQSEQRNAPLHALARSRAATAPALVLKPAFSGRLLWAWRRWQDGGAREYAVFGEAEPQKVQGRPEEGETKETATGTRSTERLWCRHHELQQLAQPLHIDSHRRRRKRRQWQMLLLKNKKKKRGYWRERERASRFAVRHLSKSESRQKLHEEWLLREQKAQEEFRIKKEKEEAARKRQEEQERKLKEEWEEQQRKEREEEQQKLQEKKEREEAVQKMLEQAENELENGATWQNPEPPTELRVMEKDRANCPFYSKTGACRFGDRCSRKHNFPTSSPTLLIKSMFTTFGMEQCRRDDYDPDASLEYSEEETYQQFLDFYDDVLPEFRNVGKVIQFKVSCNLEPHLRGNVYVQYQSEEECQAALSLFNGRWYAGRQLQCEFCPVTRWKMAICGLFEIQQCPRGKHCNFLHVFRNPNNEFWEANRDIYLSPDRTGSSFGKSSERRARPGPHDDYYSRPRRRRSPGPAHSYKRNGEADRKRRSSHGAKKSHKHRSRSRGRHNSRSRGRKRDRSRGRGSRSHSRRSRSQSSSRSRSRGGRRSGSRDRTLQSPKSK